jgi:DNA-binding LytR/AlgR family response regulator
MERVKVLIMENDYLLAESLSEVLKEFGYRVVGISNTGEGALKLVNEHKPDVLIADINLDGSMDGIQATEAIKKSHSLCVIFFTIEDDHFAFQKANKTSPDSYLTKPYSNKGVIFSIEKALERNKNVLSTAPEQKVLYENQTFFIHVGRKGRQGYYQKIGVENILFIQADSSYSKIFLEGGTSEVVSIPSSKLERQLKNSGVIRVHKSYLVNKDKVQKIDKDSRVLTIIGQHSVPYSRDKASLIDDWFRILYTKK